MPADAGQRLGVDRDGLPPLSRLRRRSVRGILRAVVRHAQGAARRLLGDARAPAAQHVAELLHARPARRLRRIPHLLAVGAHPTPSSGRFHFAAPSAAAKARMRAALTPKSPLPSRDFERMSMRLPASSGRTRITTSSLKWKRALSETASIVRVCGSALVTVHDGMSSATRRARTTATQGELVDFTGPQPAPHWRCSATKTGG